MREMIEERRQSASGQSDLFTNLINGTSLDADEKTIDQFSDEELMGSCPFFQSILVTHLSSQEIYSFSSSLVNILVGKLDVSDF